MNRTNIAPTKEEFIAEINRTVRNIELTNDAIDYTIKDTSQAHADRSLFAITKEITITYKGKTKVYQAGHLSTFPYEFVTDYESGFYS